jgi:hypothetical protein
VKSAPDHYARRACEKCGSAIGEVHADECPVDRHAPIVEVDYVRADLAVVLDADLLANLDARAERHNTDRVGYLRWMLTGKAPEETPAKPRRKKP